MMSGQGVSSSVEGEEPLLLTGGVSEHNIMRYLGMVEQRTNEVCACVCSHQ